MDTQKFNMGWLIVSLENLHGNDRQKAKRQLLNDGFSFIVHQKRRNGLMARACASREKAKGWITNLEGKGIKAWFTCRAAWERSWMIQGRPLPSGIGGALAARLARSKLPANEPGGKILIILCPRKGNSTYTFVRGSQADIESIVRGITLSFEDSIRAILIA